MFAHLQGFPVLQLPAGVHWQLQFAQCAAFDTGVVGTTANTSVVPAFLSISSN
jgi:hypothetical protein